MPKKLRPKSEIAAVNGAARACGMSYGRYVSLTGGQVPPPEDLLLRGSSRARRCEHCQRLYIATGLNQRYCSPYCRKAAYEERIRKGADV